MKSFARYLLVNHRGEMRVLKTKPSTRYGECVFVLRLQVPEPKVLTPGEIVLTMPDFYEPEWELIAGEVTA